MTATNPARRLLVLALVLTWMLGVSGASSEVTEVIVGPLVKVPWKGGYGVFSAQLNDGAIIMADGGQTLKSRDGGATWQGAAVLGTQFVQCKDGTIIGLAGSAASTDKPGHYQLTVHTSTDNGQTSQNTTAPLLVMDAASYIRGDDFKKRTTLAICNGIVELDDGALLATAYGNFKTDNVPIKGFGGKDGIRMYRTYTIRSNDRGKTWAYESTIAYDGVTGQESFCEASLVNLGNNELLATMRTGRYAPLYQCRSLDGGKTWGKPESTHVLGLWNGLTLLDNGVLVCAYGWRSVKPGNEAYVEAHADFMKRYVDQSIYKEPDMKDAGDYVMFSTDGGRTWTHHTLMATRPTAGYVSVAPAGPDAFIVMSHGVGAFPGVKDSIYKKYGNGITALARIGRVVTSEE
jgi:photosystem II stability/assembly factor-like uncharacterized protein